MKTWTLAVIGCLLVPSVGRAQNLSYDANGNARIVVYFGATAASAGSGTTDGGTLRITGATDDPAFSRITSSTGRKTAGSALATTAFQIGGTYNLTPPTLTDTQEASIQLDANGYLKVNIAAGGASGGTALADEGAFTEGTTDFTPSGGYYNSAPTALTSGQSGAVSLTAHRAFNVTLYKSDGTEITPSVDATTDTTAQTSGPQQFVIGASSAPTAVTTGNSVGMWGDLNGRTHVTGDSSMTPLNIAGNAGGAIDAATGAAPPANAVYIAGRTSGATGGLLTGITVCDSDAVINISTATTTRIVTGVSGRKVHICSIDLLTAAANNVALIEGTQVTTACDTSPAGMAGGTTAASGWNFAANGGLTQGAGLGSIMTTATAADDVCLVTSAATQLSGHVKYAIF